MQGDLVATARFLLWEYIFAFLHASKCTIEYIYICTTVYLFAFLHLCLQLHQSIYIYLHQSIFTCLQVHQSTVYSGCTGWSLLQGPPHRSSHGRNGGLPGVTPPPPPQLPALSFSKRVYLVRFSNCLQSHFIEWVFYDDLPKCHMLLMMKMMLMMTKMMVIILIECRMLAASLSIFSLVAAASTKNSTRQN